MPLDTTALLSLQRTAMAWKLFGRETTPAQLPAELRSILAQMQRERLALKGDLTSLLQSADGLKSLSADADTLTGQVRDLSNTFDRARQRQDELNRAGEAAAARLHALEERQQQVQGSVGAAQTRVTGLEEGFAHLTQAAADAADTKRQLGTLKALADYVTQKVAVLEQQRDVVDRALGKATQLDDVMRDIDAKIRTHEANAKSLGALETRVTDLQALHGDLLRSEE